MEAIIGKDYSGKSYLRCLVWEDDELKTSYLIPGIPNYTRTNWNLEKPILDKLNKEWQDKLTKLVWRK